MSTAATGTTDWHQLAIEQLTWHWEHARHRLDGLTDAEYLWEPVEGAWSVRPRGTAATPQAAGAGEWEVDFALPEPTPAPVTTIAWRLAHLIVGIFGARAASHFGFRTCDYQSWEYAGTAAGALAQLDETYAAWLAGVRGLDPSALARPVGEAEGPFAEHPMAELVLHINREAIHHLAEIALLRDLWAHRPVLS
ncbi:DinB family protein [Ornithinimicrobium cavernae]|uniref:DinB family protein n=1 Tax=Ornithinimicrobium cavernae TaxID=2666047 RepID=UPI000D689DB1|nr:DinB family protein [Ornithinimicrobium cavernae]